MEPKDVSGAQHTPASVAQARRDELDSTPLAVVAGAVPHDLTGHVFIVGPVGNVATKGLPRESGDSLFNGDGMIYRLDFAGGSASVTTRLVKPPCYFADEATQQDRRYAHLRFRNRGLLRFSTQLGLRNFGNTGFLPFRFGDGPARMLVTYDAGRPLEIDTRSLRVVTPMGHNDEWTAEALEGQPFEAVLATAHPAVDARTGEVFCVNFGRSTRNLMRNEGLTNLLDALPDGPEELIRSLLPQSPELVTKLAAMGSEGVTILARKIRDRLGLRGVVPDDFVYIIRWDGSGRLHRWQVKLPNGSPVVIHQSMHQIAVTRDYVVLMDTGLKIELDQAYNVPFSTRFETVARAIRLATTEAQHPYTWAYVIRRDDLAGGLDARADVVAIPVRLDMEALHFLVDYENPDDAITLHVAHNNALDPAEWVRKFDESPYTRAPNPPATHGVPCVAGMDISTLGRWTLDMRRRELRKSWVQRADPTMWGVTLYAGADLTSDAAIPGTIETLYWCSVGLFPDLMTSFLRELYEDYPRRAIPRDELDLIARGGGRPSSVFRVDARTLAVVDQHQVGPDRVASSVQFVPRAGGSGGPTDGYLVCTVLDPDGREVWVYDARDLAKGPVCRLANDDLVFAMTLHTAWLPEIADHAGGYAVHPEDDYGPKIAVNHGVRRLFEDHVYPQFP